MELIIGLGLAVLILLVVILAVKIKTKDRFDQLETFPAPPTIAQVHDTHHVVWMIGRGVNVSYFSCIDCPGCSCHEPEILAKECEGLEE